jgi:hypothetical protein
MLVSPARYQPKWYKRRENVSFSKVKKHYKVHLLNDQSIQWLYQRRITYHLDNEIGETVEEEWENLTSILTKAANESLATKHKGKINTGVRNWDDELAQIVEDKRAAFNTFISTGKQKDELIYNMKRSIIKKKSGKGIENAGINL